MAVIVEDFIVIKVSKLVKNNTATSIIDAEMKAALEEVLAATVIELTGDNSIIVEIEEA